MRALGLNTSDPRHEGYYKLMRVSSAGMGGRSSTPGLTVGLGRGDQGVQPTERRPNKSDRRQTHRHVNNASLLLASYSTGPSSTSRHRNMAASYAGEHGPDVV
jgi:hypothetical protein